MLDDFLSRKIEENAVKQADAIGKLYFSIVEVDLNDGQAIVYKNDPKPEIVDKSYSWVWLLTENLQWFYPDDRSLVYENLSMEGMSRMLEQKENERRLELRIHRENKLPSWVEIEISIISREERKLLVTIRNIAQQRLLENIVKLYVYNNCDYFIYLDAKNNRYEMLWGQKDVVTIPEPYSNDYVGTFLNYIETYVAPEDRERMKQDIMPEYILAELENNKELSFSYGLIEPERGYTRKRLQFLYYDKFTQTVLLSRTDVTDLYMEAKKQNEAFRQAVIQAQNDPLTGVYNHQTVEILIREELTDKKPAEGALLFIDLDNFKNVNDIQGHHEGDEALRFVAKAIQGSLRGKDLVGRVGGDEFIVYLRGPITKSEIEQCAGRLCKAISQEGDNSPHLTCSIGIAQFPRDGKDYETLYKHADAAMYQAKTAGKAGYALWKKNDVQP